MNTRKRNKIENLKVVQQVLQERAEDTNAAVLVNQLMAHGLTSEQWVAKFSDFFERAYTRDISEISVLDDKWYRYFLELALTRPGWYDLLPEGLFFQPTAKDYQKQSGLDVEEEVQRYRKEQLQEKEVRQFFQPFENEIFLTECNISDTESRLLKSFQQPNIEIWNFPSQLDHDMKTSLARLLKYTVYINGDLSLMEQALSLLLEEPVKINRLKAPTTHYSDSLQLGMSYLGNNMICGSDFWEESITLQYQIGPLKKQGLNAFLDKGKCAVLIDVFNSYFAPVDGDIEFEILLEPSVRNSALEQMHAPILGYNTVL